MSDADELSIEPITFPVRWPALGEVPWMKRNKEPVRPLDLRHPPPRTEGKSSTGPATPPPSPAETPSSPPAGPEPEPAPRGPAVADLERVIEALVRARAQVVADGEADLCLLAVSIAEVLVERELESDPELHRALVRHALEALSSTDEGRVRVSPAVYALLAGAKVEGEVLVEGAPLVEDATLRGAGCIVDTPRARVDGRLTERLRAVARAFEDRHADQAGEDD